MIEKESGLREKAERPSILKDSEVADPKDQFEMVVDYLSALSHISHSTVTPTPLIPGDGDIHSYKPAK